MKERWLAVSGYEGYYEVSNLGRIRRLTNGVGIPGYEPTLMSLDYPKKAKGQIYYPSLRLSKRGIRRRFKVHTLVLTAFVGSRPKGKEAAHWDGDPSNAQLSNLRWATPLQNSHDKERHGTIARGENTGHAKLDSIAVKKIHKRLERRENATSIASDYGVDPGTIYAINHGRNWKHTGPALNVPRSTKLDETTVIKIKRRLAAGKESGSAIGRAFGVHFGTISDIKLGKIWRNVSV